MAAKKTEGKTAKKEASKTEAYVVFARRFRPQIFSDVVGQEMVTAALRHALKSGRLAQAFLFTGPRGVGKTSLARIFAKALTCLNGKGANGVAEEPCNDCESCLSIQNGSALDVVEMDAATNRGIGDVQKLRENVGLAPSQLRYKIYIVDEVHMLTTEAWNAFLKTLEEPPAHVKFIFATTDPDRIPETILSRCQRFDLRRIGLLDIVKRLKQICDEEKLEATTGALERIAAISKGGLRDAEGLLDQAVNLGEGTVDEDVVRRISGTAPDELLFDLLHACADGRVADALGQAGKAIDAGADPDDLLVELSERLRGTLIGRTCGADSSLLEGQSHLKESYTKLGQKLSEDQLLQLLQLFTAARRQVRDAAQARLPLEMALVRASRARELVDLGKLVLALESGAARTAQATAGIREGPRPNSAGRPAGVEASPAALISSTAAKTPVPAQVPVAASAGLPERWNEVVAAVRAVPAGAFIAGALAHVRGANLDAAAGRIEMGFGAAQMFYRESLEKTERLGVLQQALEQVYGQKLAVTFVRMEGPPARPALAPAPRPVPAAKMPDPPQARSTPRADEPEDVTEAEVAFDDEGALPIETAEPGGDEDRAGTDSGESPDDDLGPPAAADKAGEIEVAVAPALTASPVDEKEILKNPIVKALVDRVEGEIRRVERRPARVATQNK